MRRTVKACDSLRRLISQPLCHLLPKLDRVHVGLVGGRSAHVWEQRWGVGTPAVAQTVEPAHHHRHLVIMRETVTFLTEAGGFSGGVSLDEPLLPASSLTRNTRLGLPAYEISKDKQPPISFR